MYRLQELKAWAAALFETADVLVLPTVPTTFTRAQMAEDPVGNNLALGRYTQFTNLLDLAAVAVPAGFTADGRPCGVTLVGPAFSETRLLAAAAALVEVP
jgi:allophanate hydrolase